MSREKKVEAILVIVVGFLVLYFLLNYWKGADYKWMLYTSLVVGVLSLMSEAIMNAITWVWFKIAHILGMYVTGPILLGLVFFVILFPISLLAKVFSTDNLMRKRRKDTYFVERNHAYSNKDIENIW